MVDPGSVTLGVKLAEAIVGYAINKSLDSLWKKSLRGFLEEKRKKEQFGNALELALTKLRKRFPDYTEAFFDEHFLTTRAAPELALLFTREKAPSSERLAKLFQGYFKTPTPDAIDVCREFLALLQNALKAQPEFQQLLDSRQTDQIHTAVLEDLVPTSRKISEDIKDLRTSLLGQEDDYNHSVTSKAITDVEEKQIFQALGQKSKSLLRWPQTLRSGEWINRPELDQILAIINENEHSTVIVQGEPGSGKSAVLGKLGKVLQNKGIVLLALKADLIPRTVETIQKLKDWLTLPASPTSCFTHLANELPVVLLIDQLDALCDLIDLHTERLSVLLQLVGQLSGIKNIHIVLSCREFEFRHDVRFLVLDAQEVHLSIPPWDDISQLLGTYGINVAGWPQGFREILRVPQHLNVFLNFLSDSESPVFDSYQAMLEEVWQKRILNCEGSQNRVELVHTIATRMSEQEELWLPSAMFDPFHEELRQLEAAGILRHSDDGRRIAFSHQTLFDFARARAFASQGCRLSEYVLERQDALYVRPTLWSSLIYLRGASRATYRAEFDRLWNTSNLRLHVRFLLIEFLGQLSSPDDQEAAWLLPYLEDFSLQRKVLWAMQGSQGWFERLKKTYLPSLMTGDNKQAWEVSIFLGRAMSFARESVLSLIERYWLPFPEKDVCNFQVLRELTGWDERAEVIAETVIQRTEVANHFVELIASQVSIKVPKLAPRLIGVKLKTDLAKARDSVCDLAKVSSEELPAEKQNDEGILRAWKRDEEYYGPFRKLLEDNCGWYNLMEIAEAAPAEFINIVFPWFVEVVESLAYDAHPFVNTYRRDRSLATTEREGELRREYPLMSAIKAAVAGLADLVPEAYIEFVSQWQSSDLLAVHCMLAHGLERLTAKQPQAVLDYLLGDPHRMVLGGYGNDHQITQRLISSLVPHLNNTDAKRLEDCLINWRNYSKQPEGDDPKTRFDRKRWEREHRLRLFRSFPRDRLTPQTRRFVEMEGRALPDCRDWDSKGEGGWIGSPMSSNQMERAKDCDILNLFEELVDDTGSDHPRHSMQGGSRQASQAFGDFAKQNPERAIRLIRQFKPGTQERPVSYALRALADEKEIDRKMLIDLIVELHDKGFKSDSFRDDVACALEKCACQPDGLPDHVCNLLIGWLNDWHQATDEDSKESPSPADENDEYEYSLLWQSSHIRFLPHGNFPILRALTYGYLLRKPPNHDAWLKVLEERIERDENPAVWSALADDLRWLRGAEKPRAESLILRLFEKYPEVLFSLEGVRLVAWVHHWISSGSLKYWLEAMRTSDWEKGPQAFGELVMLRRALYPTDQWCVEQIEMTLKGEDLSEPEITQLRLGCAYTSANLWADPKFRRIVTPVLVRLMPLSNKSIASAILDIFRMTTSLSVCEETRAVLDGITALPDILGSSRNSFLIDRLSDIVQAEPERVYSMCSSLIDQSEDEIGDISTHWAASAGDLVNIALTLQRINTHRAKGLELFERLLDLDVYGVKDALFELDRRPLKAAPSRPRRRRR